MLIHEIINGIGLPKTTSTQRIYDLLFQKAAGWLAGIGVTFDGHLARKQIVRKE